MENLHWEFSVLCRAIQYLNLSAAAAHIGISQPQLSRILAKIEKELKIILLDRTVRRHSKWTPEAHKLVRVYQRSARSLKAEISALVAGERPTRIAIGCLEGLIDHVAPIAHRLFKEFKPETLELDIYDINDLETLFLNGSLDIIFTGRELVRRKTKHAKTVGMQILEEFGASSQNIVSSHYEYNRTVLKKGTRKPGQSYILSNSLVVRRLWIERFQCAGVIPSKLKNWDGKSKLRLASPTQVPVYLFGAETLSAEIWRLLTA